MTVISLFDTLARAKPDPEAGDASNLSRLAMLAKKMVKSSLANLETIRGFERVCAGAGNDDPAIDLELLSCV